MNSNKRHILLKLGNTMRQLILTGLSLSGLSLVFLCYTPSLAVAQTRLPHLSLESVQSQRLNNKNDDIDALMEQAEAAAAAEDYAQAERLWRQVLLETLDGENPRILRGLGAVLTAQEEFTEAEETLRALVRFEPDVAMNHYFLALMLFSKETSTGNISLLGPELNDIETHLQEAVRLEPNEPDFRRLLVVILMLKLDYVALEPQVRELIRLEPDNEDAYATLASLFSSNSVEFSVPKYRDAIAQYGPRASFYEQMAIVYARNNLDVEQEAVLREALSHHPDNALFYSRLGYLLTTQERYTEAIPLFETEVALDSYSPYPHRNLGQALENIGQLSEAEAAYRKGLAQNPEHEYSYLLLADFLNGQGEFTEAEALYREAAQLTDPGVRVFMSLQAFLTEQGRFTEAEALDEVTDCVRRSNQQRRYRPDETPVITCDVTLAQ
ncbi:MAG: tetratricopeptide repeat protein [Cyanobacteria bacterium J06607_10]